MRVCFFESLAADLKPKERNLKNLLVCLLKNELVSTFDVSELKWLRMLISDAEKMNFNILNHLALHIVTGKPSK